MTLPRELGAQRELSVLRLDDAAERQALLHLRLLPGITDRPLRALLRRHGSARAALAAPAADLPAAAARERGARTVLARVARTESLLERGYLVLLHECDPRYPKPLDRLGDHAPLLLYARGNLRLLERAAVAIVGARKHTDYGADVAREIAGGLAAAGLVVVSGLARGIDSHAHWGALDAGDTIAVLGAGIDVCYPPEHQELYDRIARDGLLLSDFEPGMPPFAFNFPKRNRIIAGLCQGLVVVEAAARSGTLFTVDWALDLGMTVCAVPGPVGRVTSEGTNELLRQGARLVSGAQDVLEELGIVPRPPRGKEAAGSAPQPAPPALSAAALSLWHLLDRDARHIDELAAAAGLSSPQALGALLELELRGAARQAPGTRFARSR